MLKAQWYAVGLGIALLIPAHIARAQHNQFDEHDRQVASDWYNQHKSSPPAGLRERDRLPSELDSRIKPGETLDKNLRKKAYTAPRDLRRKLPAAPAHHEYQMIGGHLVLVDTRDHRIRDVIHLRQ